MTNLILLDAGPLGLVSNPRWNAISDECNQWLEQQLHAGKRVLVSEIADYEVRRELIRAGKIKGIAKLNQLKRTLGSVPINTAIMLQAAEFWAHARRAGRPTASETELDADVILAAQAAWLVSKGYLTTVVTTNVKHLTHFVDARHWHDIS